MQLTTDRLIIRDWHPLYDAQQAFDIYGDPRVTDWLQSPSDHSIRITQQRLQRYCERAATGLGIWAVVEQAIDRVIGSLLLVPLPKNDGTDSGKIEIGWHFRPASWGYGYATEAAHIVLKYWFQELQLPTIYAITSPNNVRSQRVMTRLGMHSLGFTDDYYNLTLRLYSLAANNYFSGQLASMVDSTVSTSAPLT
ncbi:GNAT family N-acetyltransferase [Leptolyngbya cf. ectocarpi LEGE 11479]|uniref:GNAT family N-acetyltransferase n=1 Tax=Leptolyngbya cf. ectocarpi LEGE 11479 TaxID=1828722 RepID=A0A928ZVI7_LEPEC|nr:GNAT family N-acetyltransferase [Leptolyngbya ectocarpi]MBE9068248.1 GNAT family N-acetyltransferase [Leptolyngbya cf. ectocarpi LEGE 11479]